MKILYINHYAGSPTTGMEYRPYYLAREWVKAGHTVTIVCASFAHTRHTNPAVHQGATHEVLDGIRYIRIRTPAYLGNGLGRIANMAAFVFGLFRFLPEYAETWRPDAVIASSTYPLDFYPARRIARRHHAKLAFELHDLWPLSPMELGHMSRFHPFIALMQTAEDAWCKDCDVAVSILPHADRHLAARGLAPGKFVHVPNGIDLAEWTESPAPLPAEHQAFLDQRRGNGRFLLGYAGAHGIANALDNLIDAAAHLGDHPVDVVLVGAGPERDRLMAKAQTLGVRNATFLGPLPKPAIPTWLREMDGLFLGFQNSPLYQFGVSPNKLFDYMMAGKPIVYAINASNDEVQDAGCGLSVKPDDPRAVADGIFDLLHMEPEARQAMGSRGKDYILARHTYPTLAARFLDALGPAFRPA